MLIPTFLVSISKYNLCLHESTLITIHDSHYSYSLIWVFLFCPVTLMTSTGRPSSCCWRQFLRHKIPQPCGTHSHSHSHRFTLRSLLPPYRRYARHPARRRVCCCWTRVLYFEYIIQPRFELDSGGLRGEWEAKPSNEVWDVLILPQFVPQNRAGIVDKQEDLQGMPLSLWVHDERRAVDTMSAMNDSPSMSFKLRYYLQILCAAFAAKPQLYLWC